MLNSAMAFCTALALAMADGGETQGVSPQEAMMFRIMCVESSGRQKGVHPDGRSAGLFGLTKSTADWIGVSIGTTPREQYESAGKYYGLMLEQADGDLWEAAGRYHSRKPARKAEYIRRLRAVRIEDYPEAVKAFKKCIR